MISEELLADTQVARDLAVTRATVANTGSLNPALEAFHEDLFATLSNQLPHSNPSVTNQQPTTRKKTGY
jgi:hypothetical protein